MTAANRVYRNDDVFRIVVQHCHESTLVSLMRSEQQGTIYDYCVKELYKEIDYDLVKDMVRDTVCRIAVYVICYTTNALAETMPIP